MAFIIAQTMMIIPKRLLAPPLFNIFVPYDKNTGKKM